MTIEVGKSGGGGGGFVPRFISGGVTVNSGSPTPIFTLTPPAGQRIRLDFLHSQSNHSNVTLTVGGNTVIDRKTLKVDTNTTSTNQFSVGGDRSTIDFIDGKVDEVMVLGVVGSSSAHITYSYSFGD